MKLPTFAHRHARPLMGATVIVAFGLLALSAWEHTPSSAPPAAIPAMSAVHPAGPPWLYGRADARFTVIEYADLECPYCRTYLPEIKRWIDANPEVTLQWHHLPLAMHEPAASREAQLAECAGEAQGHTGFWNAVTWIYQHTRGDGQGVPSDTRYPGMTAAMQTCIDSPRPDAVIQRQAAEAQRDHITATPTLRVLDRDTGRTMILPGPVHGDALLSALDLLAAPATTPQRERQTPEMPADAVSDMPR